ncbi:amino acid ABC transporter permease [Jannaschia rubra]|uniref:Putative glutamine ABC transporter permease protein GlnM n=1 Tax=Jannaschia rubra TaxID=282197 RepID=A0A0M6XQJ5_9RHOB|nr:amino acid ABC transporter permease [Jannaschia rubra]CTQ33419.1 putative glutamine ABC transporter permease protein GlnM [Jannaschia rubra]SFG01379.1 amino acid ABC transporter membrane protein, PAAT family [Jannaschia rubra]
MTEGQEDFPWWLLAIGVLLTGAYVAVLSDEATRQVLATLRQGIWITVLVTVVSFAAACVVGLGLALMSLSGSVMLRQVARFYVEIIRGIPILVLLLYVAFVFAPGLVHFWNWLGLPEVRTRDFSLLWRAVLALVIAYSAFIAEVFRAGLQSVGTGQIEAAKALGLKPYHRFRHIVLPQAVRTILPPLGNDFVAMVKDSSLVSVVGVLDIAQLGKLTAAGNFRYFETYNVVALIYLTMTVLLSLALRRLERRLGRTGRS